MCLRVWVSVAKRGWEPLVPLTTRSCSGDFVWSLPISRAAVAAGNHYRRERLQRGCGDDWELAEINGDEDLGYVPLPKIKDCCGARTNCGAASIRGVRALHWSGVLYLATRTTTTTSNCTIVITNLKTTISWLLKAAIGGGVLQQLIALIAADSLS